MLFEEMDVGEGSDDVLVDHLTKLVVQEELMPRALKGLTHL